MSGQAGLAKWQWLFLLEGIPSIVVGLLALNFWIPSIVQSLGVKSNLTIGLLSALQFVAALVSMMLVSRHSGRTLERRYHAALPCLVCAAGLIGSASSRTARF